MLADEVAILDLTYTELEFFRELKVLISRSAELINEEDMEGLLSVLEEKQTAIARYKVILGEWDKISSSLGVEGGRDGAGFLDSLARAVPAEPHADGHFRASLAAKLKSLFEQIKALADDSVKMEENAQETLDVYIKTLRTRISQVSNGRNACKGYAQASARHVGREIG